MQKNEKGPLSHQKIKCLFFNYINFWWSAKQSEQKTLTKTKKKKQKRSLSHWKIKCLFLDYVQLLMIGQAIWAKNVDGNVKKQKRPPKLSKNKMFIFGLCSTSDDQLSDPSKKRRPKCKKWKRPPKAMENQMFIFGLRSTSDDQQSDPSKKCQPKHKKTKKAP